MQAPFSHSKKSTPRSFTTGFTLFEMLIAISIVSVITAIVLIGQNKFNNSIILTNTAYELALAIREAQTYAASARYFKGTTSYEEGYGISVSAPVNGIDLSRKFVFFADIGAANERYDQPGLCNSGSECIKEYTIGRGIRIARFCGTLSSDGSEECYQYLPTPGGTLSPGSDNRAPTLDITFYRPMLAPCIRTTMNYPQQSGVPFCTSNAGMYTAGTIYLRAEDGFERRVIVYATGHIDIE